MNRQLVAAACAAAALLSATAFEAAAAPVDTVNRTYTLACTVGTNGVSLKTNQLMVRNTSPHAIPTTSAITLTLVLQSGQIRIKVATGQYRTLQPGESFSAGNAAGVRSCIAKVTLQPNLKAKIDTKTGKVTR